MASIFELAKESSEVELDLDEALVEKAMEVMDSLTLDELQNTAQVKLDYIKSLSNICNLSFFYFVLMDTELK